MLIEFCCPVCQAALAIKKKSVGGQVNCPKCQKLILLPEESPLSRPDKDTPPFSPRASHASSEVTKAIKISVEPYRRDLENKSELLNDAVEMIKTRNERIKEIESLILETQKELWELEVEYDERKEDYKRTQTHLRELREKLKSEEEGESERGKEADKARKDLERQLEEERRRSRELEKEASTFREKKDMLKERLANLVEHLENLDAQLKSALNLVGHEGKVHQLINAVDGTLRNLSDRTSAVDADADLAMDLLRRASEKLQDLSAQARDKERRRREMEELVKSSSQDMQLALDERNRWKKRAEELGKEIELARRDKGQTGADQEKALTAERERYAALQLELKESSRMVEEFQEDRRRAQVLHKEQEETLNLLRARLEEERAENVRSLKDRENDLRAGAEKRENALSAKVEVLRSEVEEAEEKTAAAIRNQQQLAEQSLQSEDRSKELKRKLEEALARVESLENT